MASHSIIRPALGLVISSSLILGPLFAKAQSNYATPYTFTTLAGVAPGGSADGIGTAARFLNPRSVAVDGLGNIYVADTTNNTIRKITPGGVVTTLAGSAGSTGSADGTGSAARFNRPYGIAVDPTGNIYVADYGNGAIRKITAASVVTTFARSIVYTSGVPAGIALYSIAADSVGNVYAADSGTVQKITPAGVATTLAGVVGSYGSVDGTGSAARFNSVAGIAVDGTGNVYVADSINQTVRKITSTGIVTTVAGAAGATGGLDGTGSSARFYNPSGLAVDQVGNIYVADSNNDTIRKIAPDGDVTTLAGLAQVPGSANGVGTNAKFFGPSGPAVDSLGNIYVADSGNDTIRRITPDGNVTTFAGTPSNSVGSSDGTGTMARFYSPSSVATDSMGNVYVGDGNATIRKITSAGVVSTLAGTAGNWGALDGTGGSAEFYGGSSGIAVDRSGNVYVADTNNHTIRKITPGGVVTTLAGLAQNSGSTDGSGSAARFHFPNGVAVDGEGTVYVADTGNNTIRKISPAGVVTTFAGSVGNFGLVDGAGSAARFGQNSPTGLAVDVLGNVYAADSGNDTIRKITPAGVVTTLAGKPQDQGSTDGIGIAARFFFPQGLAVDGAGNVYVTEAYNYAIRKVNSFGVVTTLAGRPSMYGSADGTGSAALFSFPDGIAVDGSGNLYVADYYNNTILKGVPVVPHDFNGDGQTDIIWENTATGEHGIWLMNGSVVFNWATLPSVPTDWHVVGDGDFNGDGQTDIVWENSTTGEHGIWLMNGSAVFKWASLPTEPTDWHVVGTGDFNGDGQADIVWENTVTGERGIWLMNGSTVVGWAGLPTEPTDWRIVGTGDFNSDGQTDIVWENTATGEHGIWLMNGSAVFNWASLPTEPTDWHVVGTGDFNGDGQADIVWENNVTGERGIWVMNGSAVINWATLPTEPTAWHIAR
jgi:FG-GAP-like repeat/NHL repeat